MSRTPQQQAEYLAGRKPDGDPVAMEANIGRLTRLADQLAEQADHMGKTHLPGEGPVIERANTRAAERKAALVKRAGELRDLAQRLTTYANDARADLADWNLRVQRELARLGGGAA